MARELNDILRELDASYNPQRQAIQTQIDALPGQADAEVKGLEATQSQAFDSILQGARSRGLGFSGIPLGEQAKYTANEFLPAVARVKTAQNNTRASLFDALNGITLDQNKYAQSLRDSELNRDEQIRQFNEQLAAQNRAQQQQSAMLRSLYGGGNQQQPQQDQQLTSLQGVSFKDPSKGVKGGYAFSLGNNPLSAATYADVSGTGINNILYSMANSGDTTAGNAYQEILKNGGKITPQIAQKYYSLFWGSQYLPAQTSPTVSAAPKAIQPGLSITGGQLANILGRR